MNKIELALDGLNGGNLELQRRRKQFPATKVEQELATMRGWFLVPGKTGRTLYRLLMYVRVNKRQRVRQATLQATLNAIESWLNEEPAVDATQAQQRSHWNRWRDFASHANNWARTFETPRGVDVMFISNVKLFAARTTERALSELQRLEAQEDPASNGNGREEQRFLF